MKTIHLLLLMIITATVGSAQTTTSPTPPKRTPAEESIARASRMIETNPKNYQAYNALALALLRRARETSDTKFYSQAEQALTKSFEIAPDNFDGDRIQVGLLLGRHEFAAAREEGMKLNKTMPDDIMVYGFLTDANVELGNYDEAEKAAQLMLDLRPGNSPGLIRGANLRELFGDTDGALDLLNMALQSTPPAEVEDAAWITTQMAHLDLSVGRITEAEKLLANALAMFPDHTYALGNLAKVRIEQKRFDDAVTLLQRRYDNAPRTENLYDLAEALQLAGRKSEAEKAFDEFEQQSLQESSKADNSNRELIFCYSDQVNHPEKALEIARAEYARRHDVFTLDAYAWALHKNGQDGEARKQIETALAIGIRDARMLAHAGEIALKLGDQAAAERYLEEASELHAPGSDRARTILATIGTTGMK